MRMGGQKRTICVGFFVGVAEAESGKNHCHIHKLVIWVEAGVLVYIPMAIAEELVDVEALLLGVAFVAFDACNVDLRVHSRHDCCDGGFWQLIVK